MVLPGNHGKTFFYDSWLSLAHTYQRPIVTMVLPATVPSSTLLLLVFQVKATLLVIELTGSKYLTHLLSFPLVSNP
jgi:hypothetical protein